MNIKKCSHGRLSEFSASTAAILHVLLLNIFSCDPIVANGIFYVFRQLVVDHDLNYLA